jgi:acetyltransferase-like isoleucine patch superfamily enzyme
MKHLIATIAAYVFRKLQGAELHVQLRRLRSRGHSIDMTAAFGPRTQLLIADAARLNIEARVQVLNDSMLIAHDGDTLHIGPDVFISQHCTISGSVSIGRDTLIAGYVTMIDANHVFTDTQRPVREQGGSRGPIYVGNDVWIGTHAIILQGVTIGNGAVVAANATVTRDVPEYAIVAGTPARVIGVRGEQ